MIDLYSDTAHAQIRRLVNERPGAVGFLKEAQFEDARDEIPGHAFAWPERQLFPVHTPGHAVVSHLYAEDQGAPELVRAKIAQALLAYGVPVDELAPQGTKTAAPEECLFPDGTYPVRTAEEVAYAQGRLLDQAERLPLEARVEAFHKLASVADRHGVDLHPLAQGWGMAAFSNVAKVQEGLTGRYHLAKTAEHKSAYVELSAALAEDPRQLRDYDARVKLASVLLKTDVAAGITGAYGKKIPDPLLTVFNTPVKTGAQLVSLGNDAYDLASLASLPTSFYSDALGPEVLSEIAPGGQMNPEQLAAILPTLPADMLRILQQALASAGVAPTGI